MLDYLTPKCRFIFTQSFNLPPLLALVSLFIMPRLMGTTLSGSTFAFLATNFLLTASIFTVLTFKMFSTNHRDEIFNFSLLATGIYIFVGTLFAIAALPAILAGAATSSIVVSALLVSIFAIHNVTSLPQMLTLSK